MTLADLYRKALEELAVVAVGDPADASDLAFVAGKYTAVYDVLSSMKLIAWAVDEDVPDYAVLPLTGMLAYACARRFGKDPARFMDGAIGMPNQQLCERQLRQQLARDYVSSPAESEYF